MLKHNHINKESMLPKGTVLRGTYRIDDYLSSGGFGNTYIATHINFDEQYAIKEFFMKDVSERGSDSSSVKVSNAGKTEEFNAQLDKFRKEALRLRKLHNLHIVRVYDLFNENGTAYYVMDYINGENLKERLQRTGQPMSETELRNVLSQVLDALQEVHGQGIWHMDLKPANVMIDQAGTVKLIDFGASKQFNSDTGGAVSTSAVAYTNGYAPREQMERSYEKFGPWTDFYALGATLYYLLTLKNPPMPVDIDDDISPDKHEALPLSAKVSPQMRDLVLWLIKTNRKLRPQSVQQIKEFLNPSKLEQTPVPVINYDPKTLTLNVTGKGIVQVLLDGKQIKVPYTFKPQEQEATYKVMATAQDNGEEMSKEVSMKVVIPALKRTAAPDINFNPKTLTLNVTGKGKVHVLLDGKEIQVPYTFKQQELATTHQVTATAQKKGELKSEESIYEVLLPADEDITLLQFDTDSVSDSESNSKRKVKPIIIATCACVCAGVLLMMGLYALFHNSTPTNDMDTVAEEEVYPLDIVENMQVVIPLCTDGKPCIYSGTVDAEGMPEGEGIVVFDNGDRLEGIFRNGVAEGDNCRYYYKGGDKFEGTMKNNDFVEGRYTYPDGSYFVGTYEDYCPKSGTWYDKNGKIQRKEE